MIELALREWYIGGEWLALGHLWIAVENLTEAVLRQTKVELSKSDKDLAEMLDVVTDDPNRPRWQQIMREQIREQVIFDGDHDAYVTAKKASDGLEHGFLELDEIARRAIDSADITFTCVRWTIIGLLDLPRAVSTELMEVKPKDVQSTRKSSVVGSSEPPLPPQQRVSCTRSWNGPPPSTPLSERELRSNSRAKSRSPSGRTQPSGSSSTGSKCSAASGKARSPGVWAKTR